MHRITQKKINPKDLIKDEWIITNGLGGYALGSIPCVPMRKYHSYLMAALPSPYGRVNMLNFIQESLYLPNQQEVVLTEAKTAFNHESKIPLVEYRLESGMPVWRYEFDGVILEKSLFLVHMQNTVHISYKLIESPNPVVLKWAPFLHFRLSEENPSLENSAYTVHAIENHYEIESPKINHSLKLYNSANHSFTLDFKVLENVFYETEENRGYPSRDTLTSPGFFLAPLQPHTKVTFTASTENWEIINSLSSEEALTIERQRRKRFLRASGPLRSTPFAANLVVASDQFIITPKTRTLDMVRLNALGTQVKSIIAGYPWFTDWGRDTMISLEGLTLVTGRPRDAYSILQTFAYYEKNGLIPNMFPDGENEGIYNTADASLWFFHAANRYIETTGDDEILDILIPKFHSIINSHIKGTLYGIKMDEDGLLMQGQEGVQLTWMDAKVGDWVVTPRRGKAVEINGLWYNALRLMEHWTGKKYEVTEKCFDSFNKRFWNDKDQYLYDIVDGEFGDDSALRPNQLFAISLKHPVLDQKYWKPALEAVKKELLTPFGLRTLSPYHPDYKAFYDGDLRARDAAYHQGTVWPWLIGPFIDVWLKVHPHDYKSANEFLEGFKVHLEDNCLGSISEIFDACQPYCARGCFSQAWSIAEILRSYVKANPDIFNQ